MIVHVLLEHTDFQGDCQTETKIIGVFSSTADAINSRLILESELDDEDQYWNSSCVSYSIQDFKVNSFQS